LNFGFDNETLRQIAGHWLMIQWIVGAMIAARLTGMMLAMPTLVAALPIRIRCVLVLAITVVLLPTAGRFLETDVTILAPAELLIAAAREVVVGMVIGGVVQLLVTGIQIAGELISSASGMQLAATADPATGAPMPQMSRLIGLVVTAVLFAAGGHRLLIDALLNSFQSMPPLAASVDGHTLSIVIDHFSVGIESGIRVAAPIVGCVLMSNLAIAIAGRTMPQLNLLAVGLNLNVLVVLVALAMTIGSAGLMFQAQLTEALHPLGR
jgi:flagellar biosynthetic protein FliR